MTTPSSNASRYSSVAIILHWVLAGLILFMIWLGWNMEENFTRIQLHKSIGITILVLTVARIVWRLFNKPPPLPSDVKPYEAALSKLVQFGFYVLMLAVPLLGWLYVSVNTKFNVPTVLFETVSWPHLPIARDEQLGDTVGYLHGLFGRYGFLALLALHVAGALKHESMDESGVLKRILPGRDKTGAAPSRGLPLTLLASLGFFGAVAAIPLFSGPSTPVIEKPTETAAKTETPAETNAPAPNIPKLQTNWMVIKEDSTLSFDFSHDGDNYSGAFETWDAQIKFFPDDLPASEVYVVVDLTSADTGVKLYNDSLPAGEWFDFKTNTTATVHLTHFRRARQGYVSEAVLMLKGKPAVVPFRFNLDITGSDAVMNGAAILKRKPLELGQESDPDADWVSEEIVVNVNLKASSNYLSSQP